MQPNTEQLRTTAEERQSSEEFLEHGQMKGRHKCYHLSTARGQAYHALFMMCLSSCHTLIRQERTVSVRDLYYTHVNAFRHDTGMASKMVSDLAKMFQKTRIDIGITGGSKGSFAGEIHFLVSISIVNQKNSGWIQETTNSLLAGPK